MNRQNMIGLSGCAFAALVAVAAFIARSENGNDEVKPVKQQPLRVEKTLTREERIQSLLAEDGSYLPLVLSVKSSLREPDSFQHIQTGVVDMGAEGVMVLMRYRARNGFGGMNVETDMCMIKNSQLP